MEELTKSEKLSWLKTRYTVFMYSTMLNIPLLILLYWLGYRVGFTVLLVLDVLTSLGMAVWSVKMEKALGLDV